MDVLAPCMPGRETEEERGGTLGIVQIPECKTEAEPRRGGQTLRYAKNLHPRRASHGSPCYNAGQFRLHAMFRPNLQQPLFGFFPVRLIITVLFIVAVV